MWEEHIVPYFRYCPRTCLEGLRKDKKNFNQKFRSYLIFSDTKQKCYRNCRGGGFESNYEYYLADKDSLSKMKNIILESAFNYIIRKANSLRVTNIGHSLHEEFNSQQTFFSESLYRNCSPLNTGSQLITEHRSPPRCNHKTRGFLQLWPMISVSRATAVQPAGEGLMQRSCYNFQDWPFWWQFCVPWSPAINYTAHAVFGVAGKRSQPKRYFIAAILAGFNPFLTSFPLTAMA